MGHPNKKRWAGIPGVETPPIPESLQACKLSIIGQNSEQACNLRWLLKENENKCQPQFMVGQNSTQIITNLFVVVGYGEHFFNTKFQVVFFTPPTTPQKKKKKFPNGLLY